MRTALWLTGVVLGLVAVVLGCVTTKPVEETQDPCVVDWHDCRQAQVDGCFEALERCRR